MLALRQLLGQLGVHARLVGDGGVHVDLHDLHGLVAVLVELLQMPLVLVGPTVVRLASSAVTSRLRIMAAEEAARQVTMLAFALHAKGVPLGSQ